MDLCLRYILVQGFLNLSTIGNGIRLSFDREAALCTGRCLVAFLRSTQKLLISNSVLPSVITMKNVSKHYPHLG